ncbi:MAG: PIG-L family deacetylase [Anaerolineales bacterium]|nr:PIG-L family deacetylase [Anaerolineales bacterium]
MTDPLKLMCVLAHPDDESLGTGGLLARYAAEGVETYLVTATRGERGWHGRPPEDPGPEGFGRLREAELRCAAEVLGLREVVVLDYVDGDLDQADPAEAQGLIAQQLRRVRPQVMVTFGPEGGYGHPDHIAICQFASGAAVLAADPQAAVPGGGAPHRVSKLYHMLDTPDLMALYNTIFPELVMHVDGVDRRPVPYPEWMITTRVDTDAHWRTAARAIGCHTSQLVGFENFLDSLEEHHAVLVGTQTYYRAFSLVNAGRALETDLFEGLR